MIIEIRCKTEGTNVRHYYAQIKSRLCLNRPSLLPTEERFGIEVFGGFQSPAEMTSVKLP